MTDLSYVYGIIEKYDNNGPLPEKASNAYSNLSQKLKDWFHDTYNQFAYYPHLTTHQ